MNSKKILRIAHFEVATAISKKQFWIGLLLMPCAVLFFALSSSGSLSSLFAMVRPLIKSEAPLPIGIFDGTALFASPGAPCSPPVSGSIARVANVLSARPTRRPRFPKVECYGSLADGQAALRDNKVRLLVEVPEDFAESGRYTYYVTDRANSNALPKGALEELHRTLLIETSSLAPAVKTRLLESSSITILELRDGAFQEPASDASVFESAKRIIRYVLIAFCGFVLFGACGIGAVVTQTERTSHLIEVILSSVTPREYLIGKVVAGVLLNVVQLGGMVLLSVAVLASLRGDLLWTVLPYLPMPSAATLCLALSVLVLGAIVVALIGAGIGVLSTPENRARGGRNSPAMLVVYIVGFVIYNFFPGLLTTATEDLAWLPPLSAMIMPADIILGTAGSATIALTLILLVGAIGLTGWISAHLLRLSVSVDSFQGLVRYLTPRWLSRKVSAA